MAGYLALYFTRDTLPVFFFGSLCMMMGYLSSNAIFGAMMRTYTPPEQVGLFQGLRIVAQVLVPGVIGPAIGAAVLKNAELVVNGDGTTSFLPNANIWLAAFAAGVVLCGLLALLFARLKKDAPARKPPEKQTVRWLCQRAVFYFAALLIILHSINPPIR